MIQLATAFAVITGCIFMIFGISTYLMILDHYITAIFVMLFGMAAVYQMLNIINRASKRDGDIKVIQTT